MRYAQGGQFHEDVDDLFFFRKTGYLVCIGVGKQRIAVPIAVVEAQGDVVTQPHVTQKELEFGVQSAMVNVVRRLPAKHVAGTFGEHSLETHLSHLLSDVVTVDQ